MKFQFDSTYAERTGGHFGKYVTTFVSDSGEVFAHLFEEVDGSLIAYVTFAAGVTGATVRDSYLTPLREFAAEHGFGGKFHLKYS